MRSLLCVILIAALTAGCGGESGETGDGETTVMLSGVQDYLESPLRPRHVDSPVVFVGIDGASWEFIDPLIAAGELPNLARIRREGATGPLRSIPCYVSPPSWATMFSGALPEQTGVYTYGRWDAARHEFDNVDRSDVLVHPLWEIASYAGLRVGVFNAPMSWPPVPINGTMVTGMMTPHRMADSPHTVPLSHQQSARYPRREIELSYAPVRRTSTTDSLNVYLWALYDTTNDGRPSYDRVALDIFPADDPNHPARFTFDVGRFSPWARIRVRDGGGTGTGWCRFAILETPDGRHDTRISPVLFGPQAAFTYPEGFAAQLQGKFGFYTPSIFLGEEVVPDMAEDAVTQAKYFYDLDDWDLYFYVFTQSDNAHHLTGFSSVARDVYRAIDRFLGLVMTTMPPNGMLVVASDHGFAEYQWGINLNAYLARLGLLEFTAGGRIDYERSLVFHNLWNLYFNEALLNERELITRGITLPDGADVRERFVAYLRERLLALEWEGRRFPVEVVEYPTGAAGDPPDLLVRGTYDGYVVDFLGFENPHPEVVRRLQGRERWWHKRDGIYALWGKGIREGMRAGGRDIQDVAPTILALLGLPISRSLSGRPLDELFEERRARFVVDDYAGVPQAPIPAGGDRQSLEKKLRSLGYMQ